MFDGLCLQGMMPFSSYIVEILVFPTQPMTPCKPHLPPLRPFFCNEEGDAFIRKSASVWKVKVPNIHCKISLMMVYMLCT